MAGVVAAGASSVGYAPARHASLGACCAYSRWGMLGFLEGAIKKDGPSAGCSIVTSLLSLFLDKEIPQTVAMTGEISLRGDILKIGGLKEKIIGAYNDGVKKIFIHYTNSCDLEEIPEVVKEKVKIILVKNYKEIFDALFK